MPVIFESACMVTSVSLLPVLCLCICYGTKKCLNFHNSRYVKYFHHFEVRNYFLLDAQNFFETIETVNDSHECSLVQMTQKNPH